MSDSQIIDQNTSNSQSPLTARLKELQAMLHEYVADYPSEKGQKLVASLDDVAQVLSEPEPDYDAHVTEQDLAEFRRLNAADETLSPCELCGGTVFLGECDTCASHYENGKRVHDKYDSLTPGAGGGGTGEPQPATDGGTALPDQYTAIRDHDLLKQTLPAREALDKWGDLEWQMNNRPDEDLFSEAKGYIRDLLAVIDEQQGLLNVSAHITAKQIMSNVRLLAERDALLPTPPDANAVATVKANLSAEAATDPEAAKLLDALGTMEVLGAFFGVPQPVAVPEPAATPAPKGGAKAVRLTKTRRQALKVLAVPSNSIFHHWAKLDNQAWVVKTANADTSKLGGATAKRLIKDGLAEVSRMRDWKYLHITAAGRAALAGAK